MNFLTDTGLYVTELPPLSEFHRVAPTVSRDERIRRIPALVSSGVHGLIGKIFGQILVVFVRNLRLPSLTSSTKYGRADVASVDVPVVTELTF